MRGALKKALIEMTDVQALRLLTESISSFHTTDMTSTSTSASTDWSDPPQQQNQQSSNLVSSSSWNQNQDQNRDHGKLEPGVFTEKECKSRCSSLATGGIEEFDNVTRLTESSQDESSQDCEASVQNGACILNVTSSRLSHLSVLSPLPSAQALKQVKRNVDRTRSLGFVLGSCGIFLLLTRRPPAKVPSLLARGGYAFLGGIGGAVLMMPLGVMYSRPILKEVEDPKHMAETLRLRVEGRRKDWEQGKASIKPNLEAGVKVNPYERSESDRVSSDRAGTQRSRISVDGNGNASQSQTDSTFHNDAYSNTNYGNDFNNESDSVREVSDGASTSRWEQLRSQRNVQPSSWERIRQDNAREALYNNSHNDRGSSSGAGSGWQENGSSSSGQMLADPTFGKGLPEDRERARRTFEENMERERRGMDSSLGSGSSRW